jgi:hypothetical protein
VSFPRKWESRKEILDSCFRRNDFLRKRTSDSPHYNVNEILVHFMIRDPEIIDPELDSGHGSG